MRKRIARAILKIARWIDTDADYVPVNHYEPRQIGICYHISKKDVRTYRAQHPECRSHRSGLLCLIEDAKNVVLMSIMKGIREKGLVEYDVNKSFWTADVTGKVNIYVKSHV